MEIDISQIRALRKRLDITQKELSKAAGVSQSLIAKIEWEDRPCIHKSEKDNRSAFGNAGEKLSQGS